MCLSSYNYEIIASSSGFSGGGLITANQSFCFVQFITAIELSSFHIALCRLLIPEIAHIR